MTINTKKTFKQNKTHPNSNAASQLDKADSTQPPTSLLLCVKPFTAGMGVHADHSLSAPSWGRSLQRTADTPAFRFRGRKLWAMGSGIGADPCSQVACCWSELGWRQCDSWCRTHSHEISLKFARVTCSRERKLPPTVIAFKRAAIQDASRHCSHQAITTIGWRSNTKATIEYVIV